MRIQKRLRRGEKRIPLPACVIKEINLAVEKDAKEFGVSKSFVIAVILGNAYGIARQEQIEENNVNSKRNRLGSGNSRR